MQCDAAHVLRICRTSLRTGGSRGPTVGPNQIGLTDAGGLCTVSTPMPKANVQPDPSAVDFEAAMSELETLVERLETGELPLEESLKAFERGLALTRRCQSALKDAEQKVEVLLKKNGQPDVEAFKPTADD